MVVGRLLSYGEGDFSGPMLNIGRVYHTFFNKTLYMNSLSSVVLDEMDDDDDVVVKVPSAGRRSHFLISND